MIVRRGNNEIEFREYARWGEALDLGIARVLRERLLSSGAVRDVMSSGDHPAPGARVVELSVRVLACEGGADGSVHFRATWELAETAEPSKRVVEGHFQAADIRWDGKNEATLAAALSEAVARLAAEIGASLRG